MCRKRMHKMKEKQEKSNQRRLMLIREFNKKMKLSMTCPKELYFWKNNFNSQKINFKKPKMLLWRKKQSMKILSRKTSK